MNYIEKVKDAMKKDFNVLYQKEFTTDWEAQRFVRGLQIDVMGVDNLATLLQESNKEAIEGFYLTLEPKDTIKKDGVDHACVLWEDVARKYLEYLKTLDGSAKPNDTTPKNEESGEIKQDHTKVEDTTEHDKKIAEEAVKGFVEWLRVRNSEDKKYLVCPKCEDAVEYWGHQQEPLYCSDDGRKMVLKTKSVTKRDDVSIFDLETELLEEYLSSRGDKGEI